MSDTEDQTTVDTNGRVGFRDIYRAVGESEARIVARIDSTFGSLSATSADHEVRLRAVEQKASYFADREIGVFSTLGGLKTTLLLVFAMLGPILAVLALVSR